VNVYVTLDVGSCHMGCKPYAHELVTVAKECGANAVKFQLGEMKEPNVTLPTDWWPDLCTQAQEIDIDIYASTFDETAFSWYLKKHSYHGGAAYIKFAHSQRMDCENMARAKDVGYRVFVSTDPLSAWCCEPLASVKYYCVPEYPLMWQPSFEGIFEKFDGFSDHSLGWRNITTEALRCMQLVNTPQPWYLEKHLTLDKHDIRCPDHYFALKPLEAAKMINYIRTL
jgi:sialic acid synthase SpsE